MYKVKSNLASHVGLQAFYHTLQETLRLSNPVASRITQPKQPRLFKAESQSPITPLCRFFAILSQICAGFSATSVLASNRMRQLETSYDLALARAPI